MIQDTRDLVTFKLLYFQNVFKVVQPLLCILHVGWQVAIHKADHVPVERHTNGDCPLVSLEDSQDLT